MIEERLIAFSVIVLIVGGVWAWLSWRNSRVRRRNALDLLSNPNRRALVLAFSTPDCAPCRTLQKPALDDLSSRHVGRVEVREIDAAVEADLARRFGIFTVPSTVVIGRDGHILAINHGVALSEKLASQLMLDGKGN